MSAFGHICWFILTILTGGIGLFFWILFALIASGSNRKKAERKKDEELEYLRDIAASLKAGKK